MGEHDADRRQLRAVSIAVDDWYRVNARSLPWRLGPLERDAGRRPDPYGVWLAEIMLQQTTVPHAAPYYTRFLERWPDVATLAGASWEEVSAAWAGLGYYSRARNLHACARAVADLGGFPPTRDQLLKLPGVGPYTAAAIAAIAFDEPVAPVDGNIERVLSRFFALETDRTEQEWRAAKQTVSELAQRLVASLPPPRRPGDLAQGLMDLGATVCTPQRPACSLCPLERDCRGREQGDPELYPMKPLKVARPVRYGAAFVLVRPGEVWLVRRPPSGLLGGMLMPPTTDWTQTPPVGLPQAAPVQGLDWRDAGEVRHVFTHFSLRLSVWTAVAASEIQQPGQWLEAEAALAGLPTVGRKAVALALAFRNL